MSVTVLMMLQMPHGTNAAAIKDDLKHLLGVFGNAEAMDSYVNDENEIDSNESVISDTNGIHSASHEALARQIQRHMLEKFERTRNTRSRLLRSRRRSGTYLENLASETNTDLEWANPCSGTFKEIQHNSVQKRFRPEYLKHLKKLTDSEFHRMNGTSKAIDMSYLQMWMNRESNYTFLPSLRENSSSALKRFYSNIQTYVGAFGYLGRAQRKYDEFRQKSSSALTSELNDLLISARSVLCEIETAINNSYARPQSRSKITWVTREQMNERLDFATKKYAPHEGGPIMPDLLFAKYRYLTYLQNMSLSLSAKVEHYYTRNQKLDHSGNTSESLFTSEESSNSNTSLGHGSKSPSNTRKRGNRKVSAERRQQHKLHHHSQQAPWSAV